ncbi:MAG: bifunctional glutamate N-acetyltransferase/amino-acid acetyltransferase ArgJ [Halocynthiibacter sp.]
MGKKAKIKKLKAKIAQLEQTLAPNPSGPMISPLAPKGGFPDLPVIDGVEFATSETGIKYKNRPDVMLAKICAGASIAGAFTRSSTRSAPVLDCQEKLQNVAHLADEAAIFVNAGNANAFTGRHGDSSVKAISKAVADTTGVPEARVFTSSTGVIGQVLPEEKIIAHIDEMAANLAPNTIEDAATAIKTTDTFPKGASAHIDNDAGSISIAGIAKGSGMIAPDMATMLVYIFTDAKISPTLLQEVVSAKTDQSFNAITVDSDTSTSDSLIVAATGKTTAPEITTLDDKLGLAFAQALGDVMRDLAHQVVRDGEGATKFIEVAVTGAQNKDDARKVALSIANSPLVKTAAAGEDPNWGRVVMAVGKSGAKADRDLLSISFGDILVAEKGWVSDRYSEEKGAAYMKNDDLIIQVDLGLGEGADTVWTCDLTHQYITINADYRS